MRERERERDNTHNIQYTNTRRKFGSVHTPILPGARSIPEVVYCLSLSTCLLLLFIIHAASLYLIVKIKIKKESRKRKKRYVSGG